MQRPTNYNEFDDYENHETNGKASGESFATEGRGGRRPPAEPPPWMRQVAFEEEPEPEPWRARDWRPEHLHHAAAGGLSQMLALHPGMAALTVSVDLMVQSAAVATAGLLIPLSVASGAVLAWLCYRAQMKWMHDDEEGALIKAVAVGLLTAIPNPLPYAFFVPMGIIGWWRRRR